jgi:hypothetical protein
MRGRHAVSVLLFAGALVAGLPAPVAAQSASTGTALALFGGAAVEDGTGMATGANISWELTPYFTLEGSGIWMPGRRIDGFSGLIGSRVHLLSRRAIVPFLSGALGMHRATIDATRDRIPEFYARRIGPDGGPGREADMERVFDDFAVAVGGGADIYLQRHLALRPDLRVLLVRGRGRTDAVPVYGVHLAYHFEDHPITP